MGGPMSFSTFALVECKGTIPRQPCACEVKEMLNSPTRNIVILIMLLTFTSLAQDKQPASVDASKRWLYLPLLGLSQRIVWAYQARVLPKLRSEHSPSRHHGTRILLPHGAWSHPKNLLWLG